MRKMQKQQAEEFVALLSEAHDEIKRVIKSEEYDAALALLEQCQEGAIKLGELIEATEGEGFVTIPLLEHYCELVYEIHEMMEQKQLRNSDECSDMLKKELDAIRESVKQDIKVRLEVVFLPYKASMWDSLESVWEAADADVNCDAYVVPIPYFDRNPDMSFGQFHYEGHKFPKNIPVTFYKDYDMEKRRPDAIYIHNPYDEYNYVTSVHPDYYSYELKKYTDTLVYVPYYSTTGSMGESRFRSSAYYHADYIVIQAEKYRKYFAPEIPDEKFLVFGSPKFDRVIHVCNNPPELPEEWKEKIAGRKVYFYNTGISGMLGNAEECIKKMQYVFKCFQKNPQVCLLWRPHPLIEATLDAMRPVYKQLYLDAKNYFIENNLGIYDTTPDITNTVAVCDAYVGNAGSSVVSLFGIAGKPIFIVNNYIQDEPEADDWKGEIIKDYTPAGNPMWVITQGDKLYGAPAGDFKYSYYCDLGEYEGGGYYNQIISIGRMEYACPVSAQDIVVIRDGKLEKRIVLEKRTERYGTFSGAISSGKYLFLIPDNYPALVRFDTETDEICYVEDGIDMFDEKEQGKRRIGGFCILEKKLFLSSPSDDGMLAVDVDTLEIQRLTMNIANFSGGMFLKEDGKEIWVLPYELDAIIRWNPFTGEKTEYRDFPAGIVCHRIPQKRECRERPFSSVVSTKENLYIAPYWANMYLCLNKTTGNMTSWTPLFESGGEAENGYFSSTYRSMFVTATNSYAGNGYLIFSCPDRKLYDVNLLTGEYKKIDIAYDMDELRENTAGFCRISQWMQYACYENAFQTLDDFLNERLIGRPYNKERQIESYNRVAANNDGTCGEKLHKYICSRL